MESKENKHQNLSDSIAVFIKDNILPLFHDLLIILAVVLILFVLVFRIVIVSGPSMNHTLLNNDYLLLLSNLFYSEPERGDIVVISKDSFDDGKPFIKRIIATEGQEVNIDFDQGIVYVNGVALDEPYIAEPTHLPEGVQFPLIVEEGCLFVMGDNRNVSKDSRNPQIGLVKEEEIIGKAIFLIFPGKNTTTDKYEFDRIGVIP